MRETKIWPEPNIVVIGGGSGISTILPGLKSISSKITAIISVADDGGSTGRLRNDFGIIAPGDIRNCLVSLANTDANMRDLFNYRFDKGELKGHSFGNLFITAMSDVYKNFAKAVYKAGEVLSITGKVVPITLENTHLVAKLKNGEIVYGESKIENAVISGNTKIEKIYLEPEKVEIFEDAKKDILDADYIIMGPGSLYTSIIPNLLAKDMTKLIKESGAEVIYITNAVTQYGETDNYGVWDHYEALLKHTKKKIIDTIIVNKEIVESKVLNRYLSQNSQLVLLNDKDKELFYKEGIRIIEDDVVKIVDGTIRHDSHKIAELIFGIE